MRNENPYTELPPRPESFTLQWREYATDIPAAFNPILGLWPCGNIVQAFVVPLSPTQPFGPDNIQFTHAAADDPRWNAYAPADASPEQEPPIWWTYIQHPIPAVCPTPAPAPNRR